MNQHLAAICGDYCGKCPNYPGRCSGCVPAEHMDCRFVRCCMERGIEHCGNCDDFPCEDLVRFVPDDGPGCAPGYHLDGLRERMRTSTEAWLQAQQRRWKR